MMKKTEITTDVRQFPARLRRLFENARVFDSSCSCDAAVLYLSSGYYLKIQEKGSLADEAGRARFFHSLGLGVEVVDYISEDRDYLVTRAAEGEDMTHFLRDPKLLCRELARALRTLHSCPPEGIGVSPRLEQYPDESMREYKGRLKADTLIHGDACLPNVIVKDGAFSCFIDFSLAGLGDRHIDLCWALWSLWYNLKTAEWTDYFLECYGKDRVDPETLSAVAALEGFG